MLDINSPSDAPFKEDEEYLSQPLDYSIVTCSLPKRNISEMEYDKKEFIHFYEPLFVYQLPSISDNSSDEILIKFINTFKELNPLKTFKDLKNFLRNSISDNTIQKLSLMYTAITRVNRKQLFTKKRHVIFNNQLIISNHNFLNRDRNAFESYRKHLLGKALMERNLHLFKRAYENSNKTLTGIKKHYSNSEMSIKSSTIKKYAQELNLELLDNSRKTVDYAWHIGQILTFHPNHRINYATILNIINKGNNKISMITLKRHLTPELKDKIKRHNRNLNIGKKKSTKELISEYYFDNLKGAYIVRYNDLLCIQNIIKHELNKDSKVEFIKGKLRKIDKSIRIERKPSYLRNQSEFNEDLDVEGSTVLNGKEDKLNSFLKDESYFEEKKKKETAQLDQILKEFSRK